MSYSSKKVDMRIRLEGEADEVIERLRILGTNTTVEVRGGHDEFEPGPVQRTLLGDALDWAIKLIDGSHSLESDVSKGHMARLRKLKQDLS